MEVKNFIVMERLRNTKIYYQGKTKNLLKKRIYGIDQLSTMVKGSLKTKEVG